MPIPAREEANVRVIVSFRRDNDGKSYGVVNAYYPPVQGKCPAWVNNVTG